MDGGLARDDGGGVREVEPAKLDTARLDRQGVNERDTRRDGEKPGRHDGLEPATAEQLLRRDDLRPEGQRVAGEDRRHRHRPRDGCHVPSPPARVASYFGASRASLVVAARLPVPGS